MDVAHARRRPALDRPRAAVAASAAILVLIGAALGIGWLASTTTRTIRYAVPAAAARVVLDVASGDVDVVGGVGPTVEVERVDRFAFGRSARERRSLRGGTLRIDSRCPRILVGSCSASYRVSVPEAVSVSVRTRAGDVRLVGFRGSAQLRTASGAIAVDAFCGFDLAAASGSGSVRVTTACAPRTLDLDTDSGRIAALVPPGRYRTRVRSASGARRVTGIVSSPRAPFTIDVHSRTGDVSIEGGI